MSTQIVPCPRCNRLVRLAVTPAPGHLGHATLPDGGEPVCLDLCDCEGGTCPVTAEPAVVMASRLARSGLNPERFHHARLLCAGCGEEAEMEILAGTLARCVACGSVNHWIMDELLESGSAVVVAHVEKDARGPEAPDLAAER